MPSTHVRIGSWRTLARILLPSAVKSTTTHSQAKGTWIMDVPKKPIRRMALDAITIVVVLTAAALGWRTAATGREYHAALQLADPHADRTIIRDRLVGTQVSLPGLTRAVENRPNDNGADLIWIVDTDRCAGCFGRGLATWSALGADSSLRRHMLVRGSQGLPAGVRRALRGTRITTVSGQELHKALGPLLPTTMLLIDGEGTILMADSRKANTECGWSFEAQVGALRRVFSSGLIR